MLNLYAQKNGEQIYIYINTVLYQDLHIFNLIYILFGSTEALEFAQAKLTPFGKVSKYVQKLEVCYYIIKETHFLTF